MLFLEADLAGRMMKGAEAAAALLPGRGGKLTTTCCGGLDFVQGRRRPIQKARMLIVNHTEPNKTTATGIRGFFINKRRSFSFIVVNRREDDYWFGFSEYRT